MKLKDAKLTKDRLRHINRSIKKYIIPLEERKPSITEEDVWQRIQDTHAEHLQAEMMRAQRDADNARQRRLENAGFAATSTGITDNMRRNWTHRQEEARRLSIEAPTIVYGGYQTAGATARDSDLRQQILDLDRLVNMSDDYQEITIANARRDELYAELVRLRQAQRDIYA